MPTRTGQIKQIELKQGKKFWLLETDPSIETWNFLLAPKEVRIHKVVDYGDELPCEVHLPHGRRIFYKILTNVKTGEIKHHLWLFARKDQAIRFAANLVTLKTTGRLTEDFMYHRSFADYLGTPFVPSLDEFQRLLMEMSERTRNNPPTDEYAKGFVMTMDVVPRPEVMAGNPYKTSPTISPKQTKDYLQRRSNGMTPTVSQFVDIPAEWPPHACSPTLTEYVDANIKLRAARKRQFFKTKMEGKELPPEDKETPDSDFYSAPEHSSPERD